MYRSVLARAALLAAAMTAVSAAYANAQQFEAIFSGLNEVPPILSTGTATLKLNLNQNTQSLTYTLTYSNLSAPVIQSGIHFARARDSGGIIVILCSTINPLPGIPACPASGTVTGMATPASVLAIPAQGITAAGSFAALVTVLSSQSSYASLQTTKFPSGEIRGEIIQCPPNVC
jgi:CHRD domain